MTALTTAFLVAAAAAVAATPVERVVSTMGTSARIVVHGSNHADALRLSEIAVRALEATETRLSTWRADTEIAALNRAPVGQTVQLSPALARDLTLAIRVHRLTDGGFDPAIGPLIDAWGLRRGGRIPSSSDLAAARAHSGLEHLVFDGRSASRQRSGLWLDSGGFGKGVALDDAIAALRAAGVRRALLDLGGQIAVMTTTDGPFAISLAHPGDRSQAVIEIGLDHGSIATTGNSERSVTVAGKTSGHILDPHTGRPAPDFGSLTIWAESAGLADGLSTGLYVLGADAALARAAALDGVEALVLESSPHGLRARMTRGFEPLIRRHSSAINAGLAAAGAPLPTRSALGELTP